MLWSAVSVGAAGLLVVWYRYARPLSLPGGVAARGSFEAEACDLGDAATRDERRRDCARVLGAGGRFFFASAGGAAAAVGACAAADWAGCARELSARNGLGRATAPFLARGFALVSATPPFEWARYFGVEPRFGEVRYVAFAADGAALRVGVFATLADARAPAADFPWFVALLSDPVAEGGDPDAPTRFSYWCDPVPRRATLADLYDAWAADNRHELARSF